MFLKMHFKNAKKILLNKCLKIYIYTVADEV